MYIEVKLKKYQKHAVNRSFLNRMHLFHHSMKTVEV